MDFKFNQTNIVSNCGTELHLLIFPSVSLSDRNVGRIASNLINALRPIQLYCFPKGKLGKLKKKERVIMGMLPIYADRIQRKSIIPT